MDKMETFKIRVEKKYIASFQIAIGQRKLNIKIAAVETLQGIIPSGEADTEITFNLQSDDLGEILTLGWYAAKEPLSFTLGQTW